MAPQIVHPVPADEIAGWSATLTSTFLQDPATWAPAGLGAGARLGRP
jgi:hypothetical protein